MTDARLPGRWLGMMRMDSLTDREWRVFTGALMWSAENGTDGRIPRRYARTLHPDGEQLDALAGLVTAGLMTATGDGWELIGWGESATGQSGLGQSLAEHVERNKANARERQRRHRASSKAPAVTRDVTRDVGQDRTGQDRLETDARFQDTNERRDYSPVTEWPTVSIPT